jgi:hypothetical protein
MSNKCDKCGATYTRQLTLDRIRVRNVCKCEMNKACSRRVKGATPCGLTVQARIDLDWEVEAYYCVRHGVEDGPKELAPSPEKPAVEKKPVVVGPSKRELDKYNTRSLDGFIGYAKAVGLRSNCRRCGKTNPTAAKVTLRDGIPLPLCPGCSSPEFYLVPWRAPPLQ